jgi:hypothetical protein
VLSAVPPPPPTSFEGIFDNCSDFTGSSVSESHSNDSGHALEKANFAFLAVEEFQIVPSASTVSSVVPMPAVVADVYCGDGMRGEGTFEHDGPMYVDTDFSNVSGRQGEGTFEHDGPLSCPGVSCDQVGA